MDDISRQERLNKITNDNDIRYIGRLSYRHLRIIGWFCMGLLLSGVIMSGSTKDMVVRVANVFQGFGQLSLPLFMLANFSIIIKNPNSYKRNLLFFGSCCAGMIVVTYGFIFRYCFEILGKYNTLATAVKAVEDIINLNISRFTFMNMFVDMFLCMLVWTFLTYTPKKHFQGKKRFWFRALVILPVLYEIFWVVVKLIALTGQKLTIAWWLFPFVPTKPPMMFLAFVLLTIYLVFRKKWFMHRFGDEKAYKTYLKTKRDSLNVSVVVSICFAIAVAVDLLVFSLLVKHYGFNNQGLKNLMRYTGIGRTFPAILIIPVVFLFDYKKVHKNPSADTLVPLGGIGWCVIAIAETIVTCWRFNLWK